MGGKTADGPSSRSSPSAQEPDLQSLLHRHLRLRSAGRRGNGAGDKRPGRRTKLMKEMRERISEVERRVGRFNSDRAALWTQVETAFNARMLARFGA